MGRLAFVATVVLGAGCAQLLGLDTTTAPSGPTITPDAPPGSVTLQVVRRSIGASVVNNPADLTGLPTANWLVPDPSDATALMRVPATLLGTDTWDAAIGSGTPPVEFTMGSDYPDEYRRMLVVPQRNLKWLYALYEHPDPVAIPTPADTFAVSMALADPGVVASDGYYVEVIGGWAYHNFAGAELPAADGATSITGTETYAAPTSFVAWSGRPLDAITTADTLIGLHYRGNQLIEAGEFPAFNEGSAASISETMVPLTTAALDVTVHPATVAQRLAATRPAGATVTMEWVALAAPGFETASGLGPSLNAAVLTSASSGSVTAPYGNPFASRNWGSMMEWVSSNNRSVTLTGGGTAYTATSGGFQDFATIASGLDLATPAPLPITISINGTSLVADNMTVPLDLTKTVNVALEQDTADTPTLYQFVIYQLILDAPSNSWIAHAAYVAITTANNVTLPNDVFVDGKVYMIRGFTVVGGYPSLTQGDFTMRQLPYSIAYLDGGIFTVMGQ